MLLFFLSHLHVTFAVDWPLNVKHLSILNMHDGNANRVRPLGRPRYQFKIGDLTLSELDNIVQVLKYKSRGIIGFKESDLARMRTQETLRERKKKRRKKTINRGRGRECEGGRETERETQTQRQRHRERERTRTQKLMLKNSRVGAEGRERETETETERDRERERQRQRQTDRQTETDRKRQREGESPEIKSVKSVNK